MGIAAGYDVGTMFCQMAKQNEDGTTSMSNVRNAFVEVPESDDVEEILSRNGWQWVRDGKSVFVVGEDSMQVAKLFPGKVEIRRPLQDGVLNKNEEKKNVVLASIIESQLGKAASDNSVVSICISSPCVDGSADSTFHSARLKGMFMRLGWSVKVIEEALAVVLSERPCVIEDDGTEVPYSGVGMSFGAGRANCMLAFKGMPILGMSVSRSGDWIDKMVSEQTGVPIAQVVDAKEKRLDFNKIDPDDDVVFALDAYYDAMLKYVFNLFSKKFKEVKSEFNKPIDIVLAGGTSMPPGFEKKVEKIVSELDLPFKVNRVIKSKDPRHAVVKGLLAQAEIVKRKLDKGQIAKESI
jgi:hypothetical protein